MPGTATALSETDNGPKDAVDQEILFSESAFLATGGKDA